MSAGFPEIQALLMSGYRVQVRSVNKNMPEQGMLENISWQFICPSQGNSETTHTHLTQDNLESQKTRQFFLNKKKKIVLFP